MLDIICWIVVVALAAAFVLAACSKSGVLNWAQMHAKSDIIYNALCCHFCATWWTCLLIAVVLALCCWDYRIALCAPMASIVAVRLW